MESREGNKPVYNLEKQRSIKDTKEGKRTPHKDHKEKKRGMESYSVRTHIRQMEKKRTAEDKKIKILKKRKAIHQRTKRR